MKQPLEIEFKYRADSISLVDFEYFCQKYSTYEKRIVASGYDDFYSHKTDSDSFIRHRHGADFNQLTLKKKTANRNNFVRVEHNLMIGSDTLPSAVRSLCLDLGYAYNTSIYKNAFVYIYEKHVFCFYVVYDSELKELGRFVEIEMREDYPWESKDQAMDELISLEYAIKSLGITAQARVRKSLYEQFKQ